MSSKRYRILPFIRHYFSAQSKFKLHSPFIYRFYTGILKDKQQYQSFENIENIEKIRAGLISDQALINRKDLGARHNLDSSGSQQVSVSSLAVKSSVSSKKGRLLYRLAHDLKPQTILELGTCLGISALYLAEAAPNAQIITIEGCPETAEHARRILSETGNINITVLNGSFEEKLPEVFNKMPRIDFLFIDGDHRRQPTLDYWKICRPYLHQGSVVVFDDIHWSGEMEKAWKEIIADPYVKVSIDLFEAGIVCFKSELSKEDFVLRF